MTPTDTPEPAPVRFPYAAAAAGRTDAERTRLAFLAFVDFGGGSKRSRHGRRS